MMLKDLEWRPREENRHFDIAYVPLPDGRNLAIETPIRNGGVPSGRYYVFFGWHGRFQRDQPYHEDVDALEAQCILNHYLEDSDATG